MTNVLSLKTRLRSVFSFAAFGALGIATLLAQSSDKKKPLELKIDSAPISRSRSGGPTSYAPMLEQAQGTVVAVYTAEVVRVARRSGTRDDELLRRFFGLPAPRGGGQIHVEERRIPQGVGSGVIVGEDGYIITNSHVVSDQQGNEADEVLVRLNDGQELPAQIVGRDPKTDIAVLKIDAHDLPVAKIADSTQVKVGDLVFAIGNPMGVGLTVTSGIISATGRSIGIYGREGYENFIQTDASINPGNSGGALVDIEGRLIGINSVILSRTGGNVGIGFAIPSNLAVNITRQLTHSGQVHRGLIGISISDLTHDMAEAFGLENVQGALVEEVLPGLPAEQAGLQRGDVITTLDEQKVTNANSLRLNISQRAPGSALKVTVLRNGKPKTFSLTLGDQSNQLGSTGNELLEGVSATVLTDELRRQHGIPKRLQGLLITEIDSASPFIRQLTSGIVLIEINDHEVASLDQARAALRKGANKVYLFSEGRTGYIALRTP